MNTTDKIAAAALIFIFAALAGGSLFVTDYASYRHERRLNDLRETNNQALQSLCDLKRASGQNC